MKDALGSWFWLRDYWKSSLSLTLAAGLYTFIVCQQPTSTMTQTATHSSIKPTSGSFSDSTSGSASAGAALGSPISSATQVAGDLSIEARPELGAKKLTESNSTAPAPISTTLTEASSGSARAQIRNQLIKAKTLHSPKSSVP